MNIIPHTAQKREDRVDLCLDSHPLPAGPAVLALVSLLKALGLHYSRTTHRRVASCFPM